MHGPVSLPCLPLQTEPFLGLKNLAKDIGGSFFEVFPPFFFFLKKFKKRRIMDPVEYIPIFGVQAQREKLFRGAAFHAASLGRDTWSQYMRGILCSGNELHLESQEWETCKLGIILMIGQSNSHRIRACAGLVIVNSFFCAAWYVG